MRKKIYALATLLLSTTLIAIADCPKPGSPVASSDWQTINSKWSNANQFEGAYWEKSYALGGQQGYKLHCLYAGSSGMVILESSKVSSRPPTSGGWQCTSSDYCTCTDSNISRCPSTVQ